MITSDDYIRWYEKEKREMIESGRYLSEPTFLFKLSYDDYVFNPDNWNGGDILRHGLIDILDGIKKIESFEIRYYVIDGQNTIFIFTSTDFYEISWYKSRGRTELIKMNGEPIYLDDYIDLCNLLNITI